MNPVLQLRRQAHVTQQTLASRAGTSQSTIAAYESGTKSPTFRTLERYAAALGLEPDIGFTPRMTHADGRSLHFHRAVAEIVRDDPQASMRRAKRHLQRLQALHPHARALLDRWTRWLRLGPEDLIARMTDPDPLAREMRQVSPFAGLLDARRRAQVIKETPRESAT